MTRIFFLGIDLSSKADEMHAEHMRLVETIRDHNADRAKQEMKQQLEHSKREILNALVNRLTTTDPGFQI